MGVARIICIGTHHKTGTIWMRNVWKLIARDQNIPYSQCNKAARLNELPESGPQIYVNWASNFPRALTKRDDARFIHMIRDPRDVLLSGMRYHCIAPLAREKFLTETRPEWGGRTYKDHIANLPTDHDRLLFEMENKHEVTLQEMLKWDYGNPRSVELRYEDLILDRDCARFRATLEGFAIKGLDIDRAVRSYWEQSLFGGLARRDEQTDRVALHVNSGAPAQWMTKMTREIAVIYAERYGAALKTLGYAQDDSWVELCKPMLHPDQGHPPMAAAAE